MNPDDPRDTPRPLLALMPTRPARVVVAYRDRGLGLRKDVEILGDALKSQGIHPRFQQCADQSITQRMLVWAMRWGRRGIADLQFHIEVIVPEQFLLSRRNILIPNQEWLDPAWLRKCPRLTEIWCKSHYADQLFSGLGFRTHYIGFISEDVLQPEAQQDYSKFLHVGGKGFLKGTKRLVELWRSHPEWPTLTVVWHTGTDYSAPNLRHLREFLPWPEMLELINTHGVHICPSEAEGFGHRIVEGLAARAVVVTTDGPPMNELVRPEWGFLVAHEDATEPFYMDVRRNFRFDAMEAVISRIIGMDAAEKQSMGDEARRQYEAMRDAFPMNLSKGIAKLFAAH